MALRHLIRPLTTRSSLLSSKAHKSSSSIASSSVPTSKKPQINYPIKHIEIRTCDKLYKEWRRTKQDRLSGQAPESGITWSVEYADTLDQLSETVAQREHPVILAVHGTAGSHSDFSKMISSLSSEGARVIAPNFPTYELSVQTKGVFRHSTPEKVEYLKDFLAAINVSKIDAVLAHSGGVIPAIRLWLDPDSPNMGGFAFFSPTCHRFLRWNLFWTTPYILDAYRSKTGRKFLEFLGPDLLLKLWGSCAKLENLNQLASIMAGFYYSEYQSLDSLLAKVRDARIPVLYAFGEEDSMIEKELFYEQVKILGVDSGNVDYYDENGQQIRGLGFQDNRIRVMAFKSGRHFTHATYHDMINRAFVDLLHHCRSKRIPLSNRDFYT